MISRRDFLKLSMAGGAATFLASRARFMQRAFAAQSPQIPLAGAAIPKFVDPVPNLLDPVESLIVDSGAQIELEMQEHLAQVLPAGAVPGYAGTNDNTPAFPTDTSAAATSGAPYPGEPAKPPASSWPGTNPPSKG